MIGRCMQRHRHEEFIRFLNTINAELSAGKTVHVILDNYAAHKHPAVLAWLARHKRFFFPFTPVPGLTQWRDTLRNCPSRGCKAASSVPSSSLKPRSVTKRPSRLFGPLTRVKSSPPSGAGTKLDSIH